MIAANELPHDGQAGLHVSSFCEATDSHETGGNRDCVASRRCLLRPPREILRMSQIEVSLDELLDVRKRLITGSTRH
ncbi:hypothetical protein LB577_15030 [Mesorhizobium sp. B283B1A]|uniref:hypothetical protein n=1 Tax=Mesorhizobium TaxID=68287 RepID=UPI001CD0481A|nr:MULTISPECIES: hypothetical protein [Mesorhizobium]MCA0048253.1 hypothetical protein [Mesorhizobium sp. B283B1A]UQS64537.1 hypothetical protein M5D98_31490 [Mesorhizobium opportunistum]